jgi:aldehyde:ferredoxin oxidoreductase
MGGKIPGYAGSRLRLSLNNHDWLVEDLDEETLELYPGGTAYAAKIIYDEMAAGCDPLSAEAKILFSTGPLTQNAVPGGGSVELCFKSPLTGAWGESRAGSDFGPILRKAGFDHLIIEGRASGPTCIVLDDGKVSYRDAAHLVGKTVSEKTAILNRELGGRGYSIACIGPGGEAGVKYANVMVGDRAAGRAGAGAVLGSKNILAIAVRGSAKIEAADAAGLHALLKELYGKLSKNPTAQGFHQFGTIGDLGANDAKGDWPTKNWQSNSWGEGANLLDVFQNRNFIKPYQCYTGCPIACGRKTAVPDGPFATPEHGGAEYESISCFTAYVLNKDMDAAIHSAYLCNQYGLDTISTGAAIAFAMECAEHGLIKAGDLDLSWGNAKVLPELVTKIALRRGIGDLLAEGVRAAAKKIGHGAEEFAVHVKGLEGPAHDGRSGKALALSYGTGNRGMCHIHPAEAMAWDSGKIDWGLGPYGLRNPETVDRWEELGKAPDLKLIQDALSLPDILGTCKFFMYAGISLAELSRLLHHITGKVRDETCLLRVAERATTLQRMFNMREGLTKEDDRLPDRACRAPAFGKYKDSDDCAIKEFDTMLKEYYKVRRWEESTGAPSKALQAELGIDQTERKRT